MRLQAVALVAALLAGSSSVAAQSTVADGVAALSRGEYQRAYDILRPFAEGDRWGDPAAQFFLGSMFQSGLGVPRDPLRACAYYHRAGVSESPFGMAAMRLHRAAFLEHGARFSAECQMLGNLGFGHRFQPVTFDLGAEHSVTWTLHGATVSYRGSLSEHLVRLAGPGGAYLPLRYTRLHTSGAVPRDRHFIEVFVWYPDPKGAWSLAWHLFEVVGSELLPIADVDVVATAAAKPPASPSEDVRQRVIVRTNANGQAEWAVLDGPNPRSELIESEEERREMREIEAARRAALDKVDWKRRFDARRAPSLAYASNEGCGNVFLYGLTDDRAEAISVQADRQELQLSTTPRSFDLAQHPGAITVKVEVLDRALGDRPFCTDVIGIPAGRESETWRAVAGRVTIELSPPGIRARSPWSYRATIRIENADFIDSTGRRHRQTAPVVLSAVVGSGAG